MKLINKKKVETTYTVEFTEKELNTIVSYYGIASISEAKQLAESKGLEIIEGEASTDFYEELLGLIGI